MSRMSRLGDCMGFKNRVLSFCMQIFSSAMAGCTLGLVLALSGCAGSKGSSPDAAWLQRMEFTASRATPSIKVSMQVSASQMKAGDTTSVRVASNSAGFLYVLHLDGDGRTLRLVFPNATDDANFMGADYVDLPRGNWRLPARGLGAAAHLMAVVSPTQMDLQSLQAQLAYGRFELMGVYGAAMIFLR